MALRFENPISQNAIFLWFLQFSRCKLRESVKDGSNLPSPAAMARHGKEYPTEQIRLINLQRQICGYSPED
jgi:hypothetical protein